MNEHTNGQPRPPAQSQGNGSANQPAGYGEAPRFTVDKANGRTAGKKNEAVLGPFTVRDLTVFGSTLILFIASLIPMFAVRYNLWNLGSLFFLGLGILLPVVVAALFVARRLSPETKLRIGSLSVDQFGSVVASFAVAFFFLAVAGAYVPSMLLALVGALGLLAATVLGRLIPFFAGDFLDRAEVPAHVVARESAVPARKPHAPKAAKEAKDEHAPKAAGTNPVSGWAKRMTAGGKSDAAGSAGAAGAASVAGAAASDAAAAAGRPAASTPAAAPETPARTAAPTPVVGSPETQAAGIVPAASAAAAPSAAEQTQAAAFVPPAGTASAEKAPANGQVPQAQARAAAAAEDTRAAEVPAPSGYAPTTVNPQVRQQEPIGATVDPASRPEEHEVQTVHEAFWFAVAQPRTAVDEHSGAPAFVIEPGGWVLALEDRGHEFLVQHTDGRVGLLRDLSNIERG
ncbi:hypothetical protein J2X01_001884 [Arthrobacter ginsengisoli]|uniref:Uncharacterized protein n=1 Tax=Arthrobacter ginsengisoli TaxID=1356565 RepID=A0ABU1UBS4_9MICC|nr:hypothetical protein [Arthrobacter ginsengisoli]MDR7082595.1 hypothetical protein [Arthrobacter ginsengisoli]